MTYNVFGGTFNLAQSTIEHVKDDTPHRHKNFSKIHAYRPTSRWTRLLTRSKFYATFLYSFRASLSNIWLRINKTLGVLTFWATRY